MTAGGTLRTLPAPEHCTRAVLPCITDTASSAAGAEDESSRTAQYSEQGTLNSEHWQSSVQYMYVYVARKGVIVRRERVVRQTHSACESPDSDFEFRIQIRIPRE